jgi:quinol monooxygenase YgiN
MIVEFYGGWNFVSVPWLAGMVFLFAFEFIEGNTITRLYFTRLRRLTQEALRVGAFTPELEKARAENLPSFTHFSFTLGPSIKEACMHHVLIIHEVETYPAWKSVFDQAADIRKRAGEISYQLLRYDNDANNIVHFSEWSSLENARRFFESPELVEISRKAGVKAPDFIYLQEMERGVL